MVTSWRSRFRLLPADAESTPVVPALPSSSDRGARRDDFRTVELEDGPRDGEDEDEEEDEEEGAMMMDGGVCLIDDA